MTNKESSYVFDPRKELSNLKDSVIKGLSEGIAAVTNASPLLPIDIYETPEAVIVRTAPIDGASPETIEISMTGGILTISGDTSPDTDIPDTAYLIRERKFGTFTRSVPISREVIAEQAQAEFKKGMLIITLPKAEDARPKVINIKPTE